MELSESNSPYLSSPSTPRSTNPDFIPEDTWILEQMTFYTLSISTSLAWVFCIWSIAYQAPKSPTRELSKGENIPFHLIQCFLCSILAVSPFLWLIQTRNAVIPFLHVASSTVIVRLILISFRLSRYKIMFWSNFQERNFSSSTLSWGTVPPVFFHSIVRRCYYGHIKQPRLDLLVVGRWPLTGGLSKSLSILAYALHAYTRHKGLVDSDESDRPRSSRSSYELSTETVDPQWPKQRAVVHVLNRSN